MKLGNNHKSVTEKPGPSTPFMWWTSATGLYTGEHMLHALEEGPVCVVRLPCCHLHNLSTTPDINRHIIVFVTLAGYITQTSSFQK